MAELRRRQSPLDGLILRQSRDRDDGCRRRRQLACQPDHQDCARPGRTSLCGLQDARGQRAVLLAGLQRQRLREGAFQGHAVDDCGANWSALGPTGVSVHGATAVNTLFTNNFGNLAKGKVARARSSDAWIATDPTNGDVFVAYVNRDASGFSQIYTARSTDQGTTWTTVRVTDGTHHAGFPNIAVNDDGTVGVLYIDFDDSGQTTLFSHRFAHSVDRGGTWAHQLLQTMDPRPLGNAASGFLWGDYEGLTAAGSSFYGVFTGQSIGRRVAQLDPIFFKVDVERRPPLKYAVKFVCGKPDAPVVAPGLYFTAVNVHNPSGRPITFKKRISVVLPSEKAGPVSQFFTARLAPDELLEIDCPDILKHARARGFLKGFVVIEAPSELDIVTVYTAAGPATRSRRCSSSGLRSRPRRERRASRTSCPSTRSRAPESSASAEESERGSSSR